MNEQRDHQAASQLHQHAVKARSPIKSQLARSEKRSKLHQATRIAAALTEAATQAIHNARFSLSALVPIRPAT